MVNEAHNVNYEYHGSVIYKQRYNSTAVEVEKSAGEPLVRSFRFSNMSDQKAMRIVAGATVAIVLLRILLAFMTPAPGLEFDALGYDDAARRIVDSGYIAFVCHDTPSEVVDKYPPPNAYVLPGYPLFLATLHVIQGPGNDIQPIVSVVQAVLSGLTLWAVFLIGKKVVSAPVGLTAAILCALYPPFWWSYRFALTEELFMMLCVWAMYALLTSMEPRDKRNAMRYITTGLLVAAAMYVRAAAAPWILLAGLLVVVFGGKDRVRFVRAGLTVMLVVLVCFTPWWYRNALIYGEFVPFSSSSAAGSFIATFDDWHDLSGPTEYWEGGYHESLDERDANRAVAALARSRTLEQIRSDPWHYFSRRAKAIAASTLTYHPNPFGGFSGVSAGVEALHLAIVALALRGVWLGRRCLKIWVVASLPLALVAVYATTLIFARYLFPAMPAVIVLAAIGLYPRSSGKPMCPSTALAAATAGLER